MPNGFSDNVCYPLEDTKAFITNYRKAVVKNFKYKKIK